MPIALLKEKMPNIYKELHDTVKMLERHMHDMQDTEFTVQDGTLFMLQTRNGKRTGPAALRIAIDLEAEVGQGQCVLLLLCAAAVGVKLLSNCCDTAQTVTRKKFVVFQPIEPSE
jgi:phosphoenolpyruvate synthase/pyruvate phosphate dikinase